MNWFSRKRRTALCASWHLPPWLICVLFLSLTSPAQGQSSVVENRLSRFGEKAIESDLSSYFFSGSKCGLLFFGTRHTFDPGSNLFNLLDEGIGAFAPEEMLVEGGNWAPLGSKEDTILRQGEMGYLSLLARKKNIPIFSFEPDQTEIAARAMKTHPTELVKLYLILRMIPQLREAYGIEQLSHAVNSLIVRDRLPAGRPASTSELELMVREVYGANVDWRHVNSNLLISSAIAPSIKAVDTDINQYRNELLIKAIKTSLAKNRRLVVAAGYTHLAALIDQLNALKPACKN